MNMTDDNIYHDSILNCHYFILTQMTFTAFGFGGNILKKPILILRRHFDFIVE